MRLRALWPFFFALPLSLSDASERSSTRLLELLLEVLLGDLLGLALETAALRHLPVDRARGDERGEEVLAQLRIGHRALDVRLERVRRQRGARLGLRHAWYHLSSTRLRSMSATIARVRALLSVALHPKRLLTLIAGVVAFDALRVGRRRTSGTRCQGAENRDADEPGASASGSGRSPAPRAASLSIPACSRRASSAPAARRHASAS